MSCPDAYGLPYASTSLLKLPKQRRASYAHRAIVWRFVRVKRCTAAGVTSCSSARAGTFLESILLYKWPGKLRPEGGPCERLDMEAARRASSQRLTQCSPVAVNQAMLPACQVCFHVQLLALLHAVEDKMMPLQEQSCIPSRAALREEAQQQASSHPCAWICACVHQLCFWAVGVHWRAVLPPASQALPSQSHASTNTPQQWPHKTKCRQHAIGFQAHMAQSNPAHVQGPFLPQCNEPPRWASYACMLPNKS